MRLLTTGDRLRRVADAIEASYRTEFPHRQDEWMYHVGDCGMPQCLGGHAVALDSRYSTHATRIDRYYYPVKNGEEVSWLKASLDALGLIEPPIVESNELRYETCLFDYQAEVDPAVLRRLADEADTGAHWAKYPIYPIAEDGEA